VSNLKESEEKTVKLVVFLTDDERTLFKVACARSKTSMSQKAKELILSWIEGEDSESSDKGKGLA
jgi:hypothetical protein